MFSGVVVYMFNTNSVDPDQEPNSGSTLFTYPVNILYKSSARQGSWRADNSPL